jgi:HSP20 family protein
MKKLMKSNGSLFPAIPSLFDNLFTRDWFDSSLATLNTFGTTLPDANVMETNDEFKIEVAAPGMKRDNFNVELDNNVLTISAQREDNREEKDAKGNYTHREFSYQAFQRSFSMPENKVDGEKISARYADGILYVTVPKKEEARTKPAKRIAVA